MTTGEELVYGQRSTGGYLACLEKTRGNLPYLKYVVYDLERHLSKRVLQQLWARIPVVASYSYEL